MIKLLRVDHRLLHGQVAFSWTTNLGANCILIANDGIMHDDLRKTTVKLSKPAGTKLVIKNIEDSIAAINSGVTDKYKLFIVVESPKDAITLAEHCPQITHINLGGVKKLENGKQLSKTIWVTEEEEAGLKRLIEKGTEVEIRLVPDERKVNVGNLI